MCILLYYKVSPFFLFSTLTTTFFLTQILGFFSYRSNKTNLSSIVSTGVQKILNHYSYFVLKLPHCDSRGNDCLPTLWSKRRRKKSRRPRYIRHPGCDQGGFGCAQAKGRKAPWQRKESRIRHRKRGRREKQAAAAAGDTGGGSTYAFMHSYFPWSSALETNRKKSSSRSTESRCRATTTRRKARMTTRRAMVHEAATQRRKRRGAKGGEEERERGERSRRWA